MIAISLVKALDPGRDAEFAHMSGVVTGWSARESEGDTDALRKAWRRLLREASSWRNAYGKEVRSVEDKRRPAATAGALFVSLYERARSFQRASRTSAVPSVSRVLAKQKRMWLRTSRSP